MMLWNHKDGGDCATFSASSDQEFHNSVMINPKINADSGFQSSVCKRIRLSPQSNHQGGDATSSGETSPLGLRLSKTPSFLNLVEMKLSQARRNKRSCSTDDQRQYQSSSIHFPKTDDHLVSPSMMSEREKLKASNFPALLLQIGSWERLSMHEGDLIAKCYYAKRKIVWEVLEGALKSKIEIQWSDIEAIRATIQEDEPGILELELKQPPQFFRETNPQPRKHTIWQEALDFTGGQARICRRHCVKFPPGTLDKHYEKLLQCDNHLLELSQRPFPSLNSPYFLYSNNIYGASNIPFDFTPCQSQVPPQLQFPLSTLPPSLAPTHHQVQNFKLPTGQPFGIVNSDSPMSVIDFPWREENIHDYAIENQKIDQKMGILSDLDSHLLSDSQYESSDERQLLARVRSMCSLIEPFQEGNDENRIGMHQLEYNQEKFSYDQPILCGNEDCGLDGSVIYPQPIGWLPPQISDENLMMNFPLENSLYAYDDSQRQVSDYAAVGVGHEVDRWW